MGRLEFKNTRRGFEQREARVDPAAGDEIVIDASTHAYPLIDHVRDREFRVLVAHPKKVRMIQDYKEVKPQERLQWNAPPEFYLEAAKNANEKPRKSEQLRRAHTKSGRIDRDSDTLSGTTENRCNCKARGLERIVAIVQTKVTQISAKVEAEAP